VLFKGLVGNEEERNRSWKTTVLATVLFARAFACFWCFLEELCRFSQSGCLLRERRICLLPAVDQDAEVRLLLNGSHFQQNFVNKRIGRERERDCVVVFF
jgi:hypothetical protein